jgi:hypothetical protein
MSASPRTTAIVTSPSPKVVGQRIRVPPRHNAASGVMRDSRHKARGMTPHPGHG